MLRDEVRLNTVTEIRKVDVTSPDSKGENDVYQSKVVSINADETIDLSIPRHFEKEVNLERNTRYSFLFVQERGMRTAQGVFLQRVRIDNVSMVRIKLVTQLRKIQRRDYYRLGCNIDTMFQVVRIRPQDIDDPDIYSKVGEMLDDDAWNMGTILDISGGGLKFVSEAAIMDLPYICFELFLEYEGKRKHIRTIGKILSRQPVPRSLQCTYRVKYTPEHSRAQDEILAFIYSRQVNIAKKETGK